jgi:hypothetical protein
MLYILRLLHFNNRIQKGEKRMKILRKFAMALAIVAFLSLAFTAWAQTTPPPPPNQQTANGTVYVTLNQVGPANDFFNGEYGGGGGNGMYTINDPVLAQGNAGATGTATGSNTGPIISSNGTTITASGNSNSVVSTLTGGTGANTNLVISAGANQGSWSGTTPDPNATTFANASAYTYGGGNGTSSGNGTINQNGNGTAQGETFAQTINLGGLNATSTFKTSGSSSGTITATSTDPAATQQLSAVVNGSLNANGGSLAGNPNTGTFVNAYGTGNATYYGTSPTGATIQGAAQVSGQNNSVITTNTANQTTATASSVVASMSQLK